MSSFDESHIAEVEAFTPSEVEELRDKNKSAEEFYGVYAKFPEKFKFLPGHKLLLLSVADYCKKKMQQLDLEKNKNSQLKMRQKSLKESSNTSTNSNLDDERKIVQKAIKTHITTFLENENIQLTEVQNEKFKDIKINIKVCDSSETTMNAEIDCIFCNNTCKVIKSKGRWILSNYKKHLKKVHHSLKQNQTKDSKQHDIREVLRMNNSDNRGKSPETESDMENVGDRHSEEDTLNSEELDKTSGSNFAVIIS